MPVRQAVDPLGIRLGIVPALAEHELIVIRIGAEALERRADPLHIVPAVGEGLLQIRDQGREIAVEQGVAAEIEQGAGDVRMPVEAFGDLPAQHPVHMVVQHDQPVLRHAAEEGLHQFGRPVHPVIDQEPAHLKPARIRIGGRQGSIEVPSHGGKGLRIPRGCIHFVERIQAIEVIRAVQGGLLFDKGLLDPGVERILRGKEPAAVGIAESAPVGDLGDGGFRMVLLKESRHAAAERRQDGRHRQLPLAREDAALKFLLGVYPLLGQRTAEGIDVAHPVPGQVGRSGEMGADLFV